MSVSTTQRLPLKDSSSKTCRASCADRFGRNPKLHGRHVRLEDRLDDGLQGRLHDPVADRRDRERTLVLPSGLGYAHPSGRKRPIGPSLQVRSQLVEQPVDPVTARRRRWWCGRCRQRRHCGAPAPTPAPRRPCGGPCRRARGTVVRDRPWPPGKACAAVLGPCHRWNQPRGHSPALPLAHAWTKQRPFPSPAVVLSVRLDRYYDRLRRPPGDPSHFPAHHRL